MEDVIIVGGGPAGYTAALYCARAGLKTLVLEKSFPGGQTALTGKIENYPGFPEGIDGADLAAAMERSALAAGAERKLEEAVQVRLGDGCRVHTGKGIYETRTVILATGAAPRRLDLPGEKELTGRGVSYCAECDGPLFRGKQVAVVGGGNSAAVDALALSHLCDHVTLIHRRDSLRASPVYQKRLEEAGNVSFLWNHRVERLCHREKLAGILVRDLISGSTGALVCDGLFVCIGRIPETGCFPKELQMDGQGYVLAGESTQTNLPGVFAAGDVRAKPMRQIVTAAADGANAAFAVEEYLRREDANLL